MALNSGRLVHIDALRGIAAFAVVLFHLVGGMRAYVASPTAIGLLPAFGYSGVFLFFVISGFCIHLRWTKRKVAGDSGPAINFGAFWKRRWNRLYPAYLATLGLYSAWKYFQGELIAGWFSLYDLISHFLMLHNLDGRTVYSFNGVLWTLAIEEQLYLLYFALLAIRKRFGWITTLAVCFGMRFVWFALCYVVRPYHDLPFNEGAFASWWIWALGALAVESYYGLTKLPGWTSSLFLAISSLLIAGSLNFGMFALENNYFARTAVLFEPLFWGFGFFVLINRVMQREGKRNSPLIQGAAFVGLFSYSLYLTHEFVLSIGTFPALLLIALSLMFAYLFFLMFERPFLPNGNSGPIPQNAVAGEA